MATTNVPIVVFGPNGFIAPTESAILDGIIADWQAAFGGTLNFENLETPQGQIVTSETAIIGNANDTFVYFTNQVDPAFATGRMQDAIARIYFIERIPAQPTVVQALCVGLVGVVIPVGAAAQASDGNTYTATQAGTIPISGSITLPFSCNVVGPIACPANTLNVIAQTINGWDTINNPTDGVLGNNVESRAAFEERRAATVAGNSFGAIGSIIGAVANVPGVLDYFGYDNGTASPVTVLGQSIAANSIYIAAVGATDLAVGQAILSKKGPGCAYTGNTTVTAFDNNPLYTSPIAYSVTFERPTDLQVLFEVQIVNGPTVPSNAVALVQQAIINAFGGGDGGTRARIGSNILATRFVAPIALLGTWALIKSLLIGSTNTIAASFTGVIAGTALTVSSVTGTVAIGQQIFGPGVAEGTTILSGSGTSWVLNNMQTVGSEAMTACAPAQNNVQVQSNQVPVTDANLIQVSVV